MRGGHPDGLFKALADSSRRKILNLLADRELPLRRIEEHFAMSRPAIIKHVRVLKSCGLVRARRRGRETLHRLNPHPLRAVRDWMSHFERLWEDRLRRLKCQVESDS
jgi:DNA-binding transcriptional ArsR family regulator